MLFLRMSTWDEIRTQFSDKEKSKLNESICGEVICPRGCYLEEATLGTDLSSKLRALGATQTAKDSKHG